MVVPRGAMQEGEGCGVAPVEADAGPLADRVGQRGTRAGDEHVRGRVGVDDRDVDRGVG
jgi:hypothetical protein